MIDRARVGFLGAALAISVAVAVVAQPLVHGNSAAIDIIVTVFSVLAGFLVTIMTIIANPREFKLRTAKGLDLQKDEVYKKLVRQKWLFMGYLVTLALIFLSAILDTNAKIQVWLETIFLGLAVFVFIVSLSLPSVLIRIQMEKFDQVIGEKKERK